MPKSIPILYLLTRLVSRVFKSNCAMAAKLRYCNQTFPLFSEIGNSFISGTQGSLYGYWQVDLDVHIHKCRQILNDLASTPCNRWAVEQVCL